MIVAERGWAAKHGLKPLGRLVAYGVGAVEPGMFGIGPVPAVEQALERAELVIGEVERFEINEAFAAIAVAVTRDLGLPEDIVNVEGGCDRSWSSDRRDWCRAHHPPAPLDAA